MSLKERLAQPREKSPGDSGYHCPSYESIPGSKRCRHYLEGGSCALPDELMCIEWLKANEHKLAVVEEKSSVPEQPPEPIPCDLFGNPIPEPPPPIEKTVSESKKKSTGIKPDFPLSQKERELSAIFNLSEADVASFKARQSEIQITSEPIGSIWIVSEYTDQDRHEIKFEHAIALAAICAAFPEGKISSFEKMRSI